MVAYEKEAFVAHKDSFQQRMAYGLGDGLNNWSLITAEPKSDTLRVTQYSAKGSLFMNAWDPVGVDGFSDTYTRWISDLLYDYSMFESPVDGLFVPNRAYTVSYDTKVHRNAEGELVGEFDVPADALVYDPKANKWVEIGPGKKVMSVGSYKMVFSNFHHGIPMSFEDYIYAEAFTEDLFSVLLFFKATRVATVLLQGGITSLGPTDTCNLQRQFVEGIALTGFKGVEGWKTARGSESVFLAPVTDVVEAYNPLTDPWRTVSAQAKAVDFAMRQVQGLANLAGRLNNTYPISGPATAKIAAVWLVATVATSFAMSILFLLAEIGGHQLPAKDGLFTPGGKWANLSAVMAVPGDTLT